MVALELAPLPILQLEPSHGSGRGITSFYGKDCGREIQLNREFPDSGSFESQVGVVFHKLMELYYDKRLDQIALPIDDNADFEHDPVQEALRVFSAYVQRYPADEWTVLAAEKQLPNESDFELQSRLISETLDEGFTCRIDLVVELDEQQCQRFLERRKCEILPGRYIVDHKTASKKDQNAPMLYAMSDQFSAYTAAWNVTHDQEPVQGTIVNHVIRHKRLVDDSFVSFVLPAPTDEEIQNISSYLHWKRAYLEQGLPNRSQCRGFGGKGCHHFKSGRCNRV